MTTQTADYKIVIVAGQEFSVPAATDNEAIRAHLAQTFPDVAKATIKTSTKKITEGETTVEVPTVEFVKQAGTKGLAGGELAALLSTLPPADTPFPPRKRSLLGGQAPQELTYGTATDPGTIAQLVYALRDAAELPETSRALHPSTTKESRLCQDIDRLPAVASGLFGC